MSSFVEMAENPKIDPEKMRALMDLQVQIMDRARAEEFQRDFHAALTEMPIIEKDGAIRGRNKDNPNLPGPIRSRFSTFETLALHIRPICRDHNLDFTFDVRGDERELQKVYLVLTHTNGHREERGPMAVPVTTPNSTVTMTQAALGATTTGKRALMKLTFNIVERGDDGTAHLFEPGGEDLDAKFNATVFAAEEAEAHGVYGEFWDSLPVADRSYLIVTGRHVPGKGWQGATPRIEAD